MYRDLWKAPAEGGSISGSSASQAEALTTQQSKSQKLEDIEIESLLTPDFHKAQYVA